MVKHNYFRIGCTPISITNPENAAKQISQFAKTGEGGYICVSNLRMVIFANRDNEYLRLMESSLMNLPDGTPLTWCSKLWGLENTAVTNGPFMFHKLLSNVDTELKHYLLGDTQEVVDAIKKKYKKEFGAMIVGGKTLPFANVDDFDYKTIAEQIKASGANIVWTAMRAPKQDQFNQRIAKILPNVVFLGVGRAFRISIGEVTDAPDWGRKLGISGIFTRKQGLGTTLVWYFKSAFSLAYYMCQIIVKRLMGKHCYE